jgi:hypothetical protein
MIQQEIIELIDQAYLDKEITTDEQKLIIERCIEIGQDLQAVLNLIETKRRDFHKDPLVKCPACGEITKSLDRVCPACNFVNEGSNNKQLDELIQDIENLVVSIKSSKNSELINRLMNHSLISLPLLSLISFVLGWHYNSDFLALLFIFFLILNQILKKKLRKNKLKDYELNQQEFPVLLSEFEKKQRLIELYYGNNERTRNHIETLRLDVGRSKKIRKTSIKNELIIYIVILILLVLVGYLTQIYF